MVSVNLLIQATFTLELGGKKKELRILLDKIKAWAARAYPRFTEDIGYIRRYTVKKLCFGCSLAQFTKYSSFSVLLKLLWIDRPSEP